MTPNKCPGCGTKLRPDMLACPNCPMSFPENEGSESFGNPLRHSRFYHLIAPALFFGGIGATVWYMGAGLLRLGEANNKIEKGNILGEGVRPAARPSGAPAAESDDGEVVVSVVRSAASEAAPRTRSNRKAPTEWRLRGTVYDLTTLKPLAGCVVRFSDDATQRAFNTRTDAAGFYRTVIPSLRYGRGYLVTIEKDGYAASYLDPAIEDVAKMSPASRRNLARSLSTTLAASPAAVSSDGEKPRVTDFYLAPRRER